MSVFAAWALFPVLLAVLAGGCGLLVERLVGCRIPGALAPAVGVALMIVACQILTLAEWAASLIVPLAIFLAVTGAVLGGREALRRLELWPVAVAAVAFTAFAAPIVASGEATFAGYIKLDDTATWMALTDRVMDAGRSVDGLAPSTYEATLHFNLGDGYPIGAFVPLGIGSEIAHQDIAWTIQPYMAGLGALLALGLWEISGALLVSRPLRALAAVSGSQAALLYGYYLWGGIKEIAVAMLLATVVPLATLVVTRGGSARTLAPVALVCAALVGVVSAGGLVWLALPVCGALVLVALSRGAGPGLRGAALGGALVAALSVPVLAGGGVLPPTSSPLTSPDARGNLIGPLDLAQIAGVWPAGDFRLAPEAPVATYVLIAIVVAAAFATIVYAWRRRAWALPLYAVGSLLACMAIWALGSPWVDGKALAIASPAIPFAAALGAGVLYLHGARAEGMSLLVLVVGAVLVSNAMQYRDVNLAPRDQLAELERIGDMIGGAGPSLLTEYQPYGARHFLRDADPEAAAELRRRPVRLVDGGLLAKGESADTDRFDVSALLTYRTLVLRRGPAQSRPPSPFELTWRGDYYEVWQQHRARGNPRVVRHLGLGDSHSPIGEPACSAIRNLAVRATQGRRLMAASRPGVTVVPFVRGESVRAQVRASGTYEIWLAGSVRSRADLVIDGRFGGSVRHQLNNSGQYVHLGTASLNRGTHRLEVRLAGFDWRPGSGGASGPVGPLVLSSSDASQTRLLEIGPGAAERRLCGRQWDWIELVGA